ncbi:MAG: DEAD/DEAH box helicase [Bacteroidales bacterium]
MTFEQLKLSISLRKAIEKKGYKFPTPIQTEAIPHALECKDIIACAQTGTGKSAAFCLPVLHHIESNKSSFGHIGIQALILAPTRELVTQIDESLTTYGEFTSINHTTLFGGIPRKVQIDYLSRDIDILTATPGRLLDMIERGYVDLSHVKYFILDEADNMLNLGFIQEVHKVIDLLPDNRHSMLFSATIPYEIRQLCDSLLQNPVRIDIKADPQETSLIEESLYYVEKELKNNLLFHLLDTNAVDSAFIFCRTRKGADELCELLKSKGYAAEAIHSDRTQNERNQAIDAFKKKETKLLVATDVAARGIDVQKVSHVFNYELPQETESYIHRIGRTGRAGEIGKAITLCSPEELQKIKDIEKIRKQKIKIVEGHLYSNIKLLRKLMEKEEELEKKRKEQNRKRRTR